MIYFTSQFCVVTLYVDMSHIRGAQAAAEGSNWRQSKVREGLGQPVHLCGTADKYESKMIEIWYGTHEIRN